MRGWFKFLITVCVVYSSQVIAQFEFGEITNDNCAQNQCLINFKNSYSEPPVVILMSSISPDDPGDDNPSAALVDSVTTSSAWISQRNIFNSGNETMDPIYFLVAEPGEIILDPSQPNQVIEVGKISTNRYQRQGNRFGESWGSHSFTSDFIGQAPVVLSQIQPDAGRTYFVTSTVRNVSATGFQYSLEFGRRSLPSSNQRTRTFGFIAAPVFSGTTSDGFNFEFGRPSRTYAQSSNSDRAFEESCRNNTVPFDQNYDHHAPFIRKQVRNGGDGGWIRVCNVSGENQVSIIIEEDSSNRSHPVGETVAYAVFDQELSRARDVCEVFTGPVQSWTNQSELKMTGSARIFGATNAMVGFGSVDSYSNPPTSCDTGICTANSNLIIPRPPFDNLVPSGPSRTFNGSGSVDLPEGSYTSVTIGGNRTVNFTGSNYEIGRLNIGGSATVNFSRGTLLLVNEIDVGGNPSINVPNDNPGNLIIWAIPQQRGGDAEIDIGSGITLYSYIFSADEVNLSGSSHVFGSITTKFLDMAGSARVTHTTGECLPSEGEATLSVTPLRQVALMCGDDVPKVSVTTGNDDGGLSEDFTVAFSNASDSSLFSITSDSGTFPNFTTDSSGTADLIVNVTDIDSVELNKDYQISVTLDSDSSQSENATFKFVPFTFQSTESNNILNVIAGQPTSVTAQILACDDGNSTVATNYRGTPSVTHQVEVPSSGSGGVAGTLDYVPVFISSENGRTEDSLTISESGEFTISLQDQFDCTGYDGCPSDNQYLVEGSITVRSRPWTFAVCPPNGTGGDSDSGDGFLAAGETFSLNAKPVVWDSSLDGTIDGEPIRLRQKSQNSAFCSLATTENFYVDDSATNATVSLDFSLATPTAGRAGNMTYDGEVDNFSTTTELEFTNVSVTEVGSFHFQAQSNNTFYDAIEGGIDPGARELGRFFPRFFAISDQDWDYAGSQSFNYMNQNFEEVTFEVEAFSGGNTPASVENYQHFDTTLQSQFNLYDGVQPLRLVARSFGSGAWQGTGQSVGTFSATPSGNCGTSNLNSLCWVKADTAVGYEDGPYNLNGSTTNPTDIRISAVNNVDPVEFQTDADLLEQPDLRFGRVALDSAGTTTNATLNIPLRVELWDGERFVVNTTDSGMNAIVGESNVADNNVIWVEPGATAENLSLGDGGTVTNGESNSITVEHTSDVRQQVQIWLELDDTSNEFPWLQYQWDHSLSTEQDPSTVATFGIYRGNDRVIFRGEAGLIGQ